MVNMATIGEYAKLYGTGSYADTSQRIGTAVEDAIGQNRARVDRMRAQEDRLRKQKLQDYAFEQLKMQEYSGLVIPQNSQYNSFENHFQQAAAYIPDAYYAVENSDLSNQDKAMAKANLLKEVGSLKATRQAYLNQINLYQKGINEGTLSNANDDATFDFYNTLITPDNGVNFNMKENSLMVEGKTIEGGDISIPVSNYPQRSPQLIFKIADPRNKLKDVNKTAYNNGVINPNSEDLEDAYSSEFTALYTELGDNGIKSLAMDWMNINKEDFDRMQNNRQFVPKGKENTSENTYDSELEYVMEQNYINMGKDTFVDSANNRRKAEVHATNQKIRQANLDKAVNTGQYINPANTKIFQDIINTADKTTSDQFDLKNIKNFAGNPTNFKSGFDMDGNYKVSYTQKSEFEGDKPIKTEYNLSTFDGAKDFLVNRYLNELGGLGASQKAKEEALVLAYQFAPILQQSISDKLIVDDVDPPDIVKAQGIATGLPMYNNNN